MDDKDVMKNLKKYLILILGHFFLLSVGAMGLENRQYSLDPNRQDLNFINLQYYYNSVVLFQESFETARNNKKLYSTLSFIDNAYADATSTCFVGGNVSSISGGKCEIKSSIACEKSFWSGDIKKVRCNPSLYGPGQDGRGACVDVRNASMNCRNTPGALTTPQAVKAIMESKKKREDFDQLAEEIEKYCQERPSDKVCIDQKSRISDIRKGMDEAQANLEKMQKNQSLGTSKAVGILDRCEKDYRAQKEENLFGSFFMSSRNIGDSLLQTACSNDQAIESMTTNSLNDLSKGFDKIYKHTSLSSMLNDGLKIGSELSMKNYILHKLKSVGVNDSEIDKAANAILVKSPEFKKMPYSKILADAVSEFKDAKSKGKIKATDKKKLRDGINDLMTNINEQCDAIKKKFPCVTSSGSGMYGMALLPKGVELCASIQRKPEYKEYIATEQAKYNQLLQNFSDREPDFAKYVATKEFRSKYHEPTNSFAKQCNESPRKIFGKYDPASSLTTSDIAELDKEVSQDMLADLEDLSDKIPNESKDVDDLEDDFTDLLKYRPYLVGQALKNNRMYPKLQDMQAQFLCRQMREIYENDEDWRVANMAMGGAGILLSGALMATGIGSPLGIALSAASATLVVGEGISGVRTLQDGLEQRDTADAKRSQNLSDQAEHTADIEQANSKITEGKVQVGLALVAAGAEGAAIRQGIKTVNQTSQTTRRAALELMPPSSSNKALSVNVNSPRGANVIIDNATGQITDSKKILDAVDEVVDNAIDITPGAVSIMKAPKPVNLPVDYVKYVDELDTPIDNVIAWTKHGERFETLKRGKLLDDGSGVIIANNSSDIDKFISKGLGIQSEEGLILKFGDDISEAKFVSSKIDDAGKAYKVDNAFVFTPNKVVIDDVPVRSMNDLDVAYGHISNLPPSSKNTIYASIDSKIANGQRLNDNELMVLAARKQIIRPNSSNTKKAQLLELINKRDPALVDELIRGTSATSIARREAMKEALKNGDNLPAVVKPNLTAVVPAKAPASSVAATKEITGDNLPKFMLDAARPKPKPKSVFGKFYDYGTNTVKGIVKGFPLFSHYFSATRDDATQAKKPELKDSIVHPAIKIMLDRSNLRLNVTFRPEVISECQLIEKKASEKEGKVITDLKNNQPANLPLYDEATEYTVECKEDGGAFLIANTKSFPFYNIIGEAHFTIPGTQKYIKIEEDNLKLTITYSKAVESCKLVELKVNGETEIVSSDIETMASGSSYQLYKKDYKYVVEVHCKSKEVDFAIAKTQNFKGFKIDGDPVINVDKNEEESDIDIKFDDLEFTVTFSKKVTSCKLVEEVITKSDKDADKVELKQLLTFTSGESKTVDQRDEDYTVMVQCEVEGKTATATASNFDKLVITGDGPKHTIKKKKKYDQDILIKRDGESLDFNIIFSEEVTECRYLQETEGEDKKKEYYEIAKVKSDDETTISRERYDFVLVIECKIPEGDFMEATADNFPKLDVVGIARHKIAKCIGDQCPTDSNARKRPARYSPGKLIEFNMPQPEPETPIILNTL